jgi:hypothetical protein
LKKKGRKRKREVSHQAFEEEEEIHHPHTHPTATKYSVHVL